MRTLMFCGILATLCWSGQLASAQNYRDTSGDLINPGKAINESPTNARIQLGQERYNSRRSYRANSYAPGVVANPSVRAGTNQGQVNASAQARQQNSGDQWRFRHHNGQWWYYRPNNSWVVWNGTRWTEPMAHAGNAQNQNSSHQ